MGYIYSIFSTILSSLRDSLGYIYPIFSTTTILSSLRDLLENILPHFFYYGYSYVDNYVDNYVDFKKKRTFFHHKREKVRFDMRRRPYFSAVLYLAGFRGREFLQRFGKPVQVFIAQAVIRQLPVQVFLIPGEVEEAMAAEVEQNHLFFAFFL